MTPERLEEIRQRARSQVLGPTALELLEEVDRLSKVHVELRDNSPAGQPASCVVMDDGVVAFHGVDITAYAAVALENDRLRVGIREIRQNYYASSVYAICDGLLNPPSKA